MYFYILLCCFASWQLNPLSRTGTDRNPNFLLCSRHPHTYLALDNAGYRFRLFENLNCFHQLSEIWIAYEGGTYELCLSDQQAYICIIWCTSAQPLHIHGGRILQPLQLEMILRQCTEVSHKKQLLLSRGNLSRLQMQLFRFIPTREKELCSIIALQLK